jgi:hypothetical protein
LPPDLGDARALHHVFGAAKSKPRGVQYAESTVGDSLLAKTASRDTRVYWSVNSIVAYLRTSDHPKILESL